MRLRLYAPGKLSEKDLRLCAARSRFALVETAQFGRFPAAPGRLPQLWDAVRVQTRLFCGSCGPSPGGMHGEKTLDFSPASRYGREEREAV